jgi:LysM repeat protein
MASLYNDCLDEPVKAVYHYKKFLEVNKNSSDEENIKSLIAAAEKKICSAHLNLDLASIEQISYEIKRLRENERRNLEKIELLRKENDYLRKVCGVSIISSGETSQRKKMLPAPAQMETSSTAVKPALIENTETYGAGYTVQMGDTLTKISRKFYGDGKYYKKILDANKELLPSEETPLLPGQELVIPRLDKKINIQ